MDERYSSPLHEAVGTSVGSVGQFASLVVAAYEIVQGRHERVMTRRHEQLVRQDRQLQESWSAANRPDWDKSASLQDAAIVWRAAVPYRHRYDSARKAWLKSEQVMRRHHPYGMARYDQFLDAGLDPVAAMRAAAESFTPAGSSRDGRQLPPAPRGSVKVDHTRVDAASYLDFNIVRRGRKILQRYMTDAAARGRTMTPEAAATRADRDTNLGPRVIATAAAGFTHDVRTVMSRPVGTPRPTSSGAATAPSAVATVRRGR